MAKSSRAPNLETEQELWRSGYQFVAGVDEAGRGALAGPVVAAAVMAPIHSVCTGVWAEVRDSKDLSAAVRGELDVLVRQCALGWGVGVVSAVDIDEMGIATATRLAMQKAIEALSPHPTYLLIDWVRLPYLNIPQTCTAKADARHVSVAAASIVAKEYRDRYMRQLDGQFAGYGFASNKGYGTRQHLNAVAKLGACAEHRMSFGPIAKRPSLFDVDSHSYKDETGG